MNPNQSHHQIIIVGAGAVGVLLALNLKQQGKDVLLIEARAPKSVVADTRTLALSFQSIKVLKDAGIRLPETDMTQIQKVHVSQQDYFGQTVLRESDLDLPYLGAVIDYSKLLLACDEALLEQGVSVLWQTKVEKLQTQSTYTVVEVSNNGQADTLTASWTILAEGGHLAKNLPQIKQKVFDYQQSAFVATVGFTQANHGVAFERFAKEGPFALLPYGDEYRLVWTRTPEDAKALLNMNVAQVQEKIKIAFGERMGQLSYIKNQAAFPLVLKQLNRVYSGHVLCVGNAAQTMHPVAAQGLNLGLRDAATLSNLLARSGSLNDDHLGRIYAKERFVDARAIVGFTHSLVTIFDDAPAVLQHGRGMVMTLLDTVPALRKKFAHHLVFGL